MEKNTLTRKEYSIAINSQYASVNDYKTIEDSVRNALKEGATAIIDMRKAEKGAQTEFFGYLWQVCNEACLLESEAVRAAKEQIVFLFTSKYSPAYRKAQQNFEDIFGISFER